MSKRASDLMALLRAELLLAFPTFVQTESVTAGNPGLQLAADATPATTEAVAFLQIVPKTYAGFPTISLASTEDGRGHVLQIAFEARAGLATGIYFTALQEAQLIKQLSFLNVDIEIYIRANGAIPTIADIIAGNLQGSISADIRHPNMGQ